MKIIDSQVHVWEPERPDRPWGDSTPHRAEPYTATDHLGEMDAVGVDAAVIVPPRHMGWVNPNAYGLEAARAQPERFAVMGRFNPTSPTAREDLEHWLEAGMVGLRLNMRHEPERAWFTDGTLDWLWPELERLRIPTAVQACNQLDRLASVLERFPGLVVLLDHLGMPADGPDPWRDLSTALGLARYPNLFVKLSALPRFSNEKAPYLDVQAHIESACEAFGPNRLAWGSDYSVLKDRFTYREIVDLFREGCAFLSEDDREWILGKTLANALSWPMGPGSAGLR